MLRDGEVDKRAERSRRIAGSKQRRCAVDHVARPHKMISALIVIAFGFSPGNGERRDEGAGKGLVFMREQQAVAAVIQIAFVEGGRF